MGGREVSMMGQRREEARQVVTLEATSFTARLKPKHEPTETNCSSSRCFRSIGGNTSRAQSVLPQHIAAGDCNDIPVHY